MQLGTLLHRADVPTDLLELHVLWFDACVLTLKVQEDQTVIRSFSGEVQIVFTYFL